MRYDQTAIPSCYNQSRRLPRATMALWLDAIARRVHRDRIATILDVGCGTGRFSGALSEQFGARLIGVDPSRLMLAEARKAIKERNIEFVQGNAECLPLDGGIGDLLYLSMVYHHLTDHDLVADEFRRVLRPGGYLCIRNSTVDLLDFVPYLQYFPAARAINEQRLPSQHGLIATMGAHGFERISHDVLRQKFADTLKSSSPRINSWAAGWPSNAEEKSELEAYGALPCPPAPLLLCGCSRWMFLEIGSGIHPG